MSISQIIGLAGKRLVLQPSKTNPKFATLSILGSDRQPLASISMPADHAAMAAEALNRLSIEVDAAVCPNDEPALEPTFLGVVNAAAMNGGY